MKVLLIANTLPPVDVSGVGEQVLQLAAGLEAMGHRVEVLGRGPGGARGPKLLFPLTIVPAFLRRLHRFRPDVVQVHESDGAVVALVTSVLKAMLEPTPTLVALLQVSYLEELRAVRRLEFDGRGLGSPGLEARIFRLFKAPLQIALGCLTAWLSDLVLAPSRQTALEVQRDYGVEGVRVLPNVMGGRRVDVGSVPPVVDSRGFLLFVGRLRIRKGVEILLNAVASLQRSGHEVRLVVAGDGEHRASLERASRRLGVSGSVLFVGSRDAGEVRALMQRALALVVPSIYEGMPLVVLEALESGLPIVASAVSGLPEVVEPGKSGWLFEPENVADLAEILAEVLGDPEAARQRGRLGRQELEERWRPRHAAETWCEHVAVEPAVAAGATRPDRDADLGAGGTFREGIES